MAAAAAKARGLEAYAKGDYASAAYRFGEAISASTDADPERHVYFSNRCAARLHLGDVQGATRDAEQTVELAPTWAKGWSRLGNCLSRDAARISEATAALEKAVRLGNPDAGTALEDLKRRETSSSRASASSSSSPFGAGASRLVSYLTARAQGTSFVARARYAAATEAQRWLVKAALCMVAYAFGCAIFGAPELPFGLGSTHRGARRQRNDGYYGSDDDGYDHGSGDVQMMGGVVGGLGTLASMGALYLAYKQGASPYTLMMIANALGLGGRRRGYGGIGGMPFGMGGGMPFGMMGGRRGFGRGGFF
jgi:tetratricopeptide (TPR) repeat protein